MRQFWANAIQNLPALSFQRRWVISVASALRRILVFNMSKQTNEPEDFAVLSDKVRAFTEQSHYYHSGEPIVYQNEWELSKDKPTVVELFCGLGGTTIGFEMAGFQTILGLDIHKPSIDTFRKSHPAAVSILGDIRTVLSLDGHNSSSILTKMVKQQLGGRRLDVLVAGIPCQGFSITNRKRNEFDERNYLFYYFLEAAKCLKPNVVMIENVSGLKSLSNGKFAKTIEHFLEYDAGYSAHHQVLNAGNYGVPQNRRRVVFLGAEGSLIDFPKAADDHILTVRDAISDLPKLGSGESANKYNREDSGLSEYAKLMKGSCTTLFNHEAPKHLTGTIKRIDSTKQGESIYRNFKQRIRLSWNSPSPTLVSGGIRPQFQFGHPSQARGETVRERARIQSIPDWVDIQGGMVQGRVQTGNAVPPLLAKALALNIKRYLNNSCSGYGSAQRPLPTISSRTQ